MLSRFALLVCVLVLVAACDDGGGAYQPIVKKSTEYTGLLINTQQSGSNEEITSIHIAHKTTVTWIIQDPAGNKVIAKEDIPASALQMKGVMYQWKRAVALEEGRSLYLGDNPLEIAMQSLEFTGPEEGRTAVITISDSDADALRNLPQLQSFLNGVRIVFLTGKLGG
jgi:hypothetical protein